MFGPLAFEEEQPSTVHTETRCFLCEDTFNLDLSFAIFLRHLFDVHKMVIEDVQNIKKLHDYVEYWRERFQKTPVESIIPGVRIENGDEKFLVLSDLIEEDRLLRHRLRLEHAVEVQEFERTDGGYKKGCLFCRTEFEGRRPDFLEHLSSKHNLHLGNPQNLVFIEELVNKIESKLESLVCIYCNNSFPERFVLKEHMRKKLHKRINPDNQEYDKYYIVNYLEPGKTWQAMEKEEDSYAVPPGGSANSDEDYNDWKEQEVPIRCLFCVCSEVGIRELCSHMEREHGFSFAEVTRGLDYYQKVKMVNYARKTVHDLRCFRCDFQGEKLDELERHWKDNGHRTLEVERFDLPEFYFPTYENDAFLYSIDDVEDG